mmetsp:Transcript_3294/g.8238  ORF Transcript_3294/g.8238 Transcript_3294/m.8238 type:complete len:243 (-) Transcript_3294:521-1249(-)
MRGVSRHCGVGAAQRCALAARARVRTWLVGQPGAAHGRGGVRLRAAALLRPLAARAALLFARRGVVRFLRVAVARNALLQRPLGRGGHPGIRCRDRCPARAHVAGKIQERAAAGVRVQLPGALPPDRGRDGPPLLARHIWSAGIHLRRLRCPLLGRGAPRLFELRRDSRSECHRLFRRLGHQGCAGPHRDGACPDIFVPSLSVRHPPLHRTPAARHGRPAARAALRADGGHCAGLRGRGEPL